MITLPPNNGRRPRIWLPPVLMALLTWTATAFAAELEPGSADREDRELLASSVPEAVVERVNDLRREIARHDDLYFRQSAPEISDFEYDQLKAELLRLEEKYPNGDYDEPPVARIGDDRTGGFVKGHHRSPMLSLDKAMSDDDLAGFHRRVTDLIGRDDLEYWVEPKFDGIAISLTYKNGELVKAVTRGNGFEGDDITENVRTIDGLPERLNTENGGGEGSGSPIPEIVEIRGEIFISFSRFAEINAAREAAGEPAFANPRNLAAGTSKLHDPSEVAERGLELVCFGWGAYEPAEVRPATMEEFRQHLKFWGFPTVVDAYPATGLAEMRAAVDRIDHSRDDFGFPVDGAVVKLASTAEQELLGSSSSAPRWAIARKFAPERVATRLLDITLQVGRSGVVTPVAEVEPVWLEGSTVARATLHNADEIARRDLRIGDRVFVEKAGDIIPVVVGVDLTERSPESRPFEFPEKCPACRETLSRREGEAAHRCVNTNCPALVTRRLEHFASTEAMNIRGLGPATIANLVEYGGVRTVADLYRLREEDLLPISGLGERSAQNLLAAIEVSREADWERVIYSLSIPGIGMQRARILARKFPDWNTLMAANRKSLTAPKAKGGAGLGESAAAAFLEHLANPETKEVWLDLGTWLQ